MENTFIGREISFGAAIEAVRGVAEAGATKWFRKVNATIIPKTDRVVDDSSFGALEDAAQVRTVRKHNEGTLEGIVHADAIGYIFANLYGAPDSALVAGETEVFEHTFELDQSIQHPTLTLFVKDADVRDSKIANGVVSALELTVATDNYVRFKADFIGKEETSATSDPSLDVEYDFVGRDVTLKLADSEAGLAAAEEIKIKTLSVKYNPHTIADYVVGDYSPEDIYNGAFSIEGSFTKNYVDQIFEDLGKGDDSKYAQIKVEGEATLGTSSHPTITLILNKLMVTDWSRKGAADELVTEDVSFKAFYNSDDKKQSKLKLINLTEAYGAGS